MGKHQEGKEEEIRECANETREMKVESRGRKRKEKKECSEKRRRKNVGEKNSIRFRERCRLIARGETANNNNDIV